VPALPTARTRTHCRLPETSPSKAVADLVTLVCATQLVAVIGSGLVWIS
jgi:hypothetical protein